VDGGGRAGRRVDRYALAFFEVITIVDNLKNTSRR
jgi:hypothetical protein